MGWHQGSISFIQYIRQYVTMLGWLGQASHFFCRILLIKDKRLFFLLILLTFLKVIFMYEKKNKSKPY